MTVIPESGVEIDDNPTIVAVGSLEQGFTFFGPFEGQDEAETFIRDSVSAHVTAEWYYLETPFSPDDNIIEGVIISETSEAAVETVKRIKETNVLELPVSHQIFNEKGALIGDQLGIPSV